MDCADASKHRIDDSLRSPTGPTRGEAADRLRPLPRPFGIDDRARQYGRQQAGATPLSGPAATARASALATSPVSIPSGFKVR